MKKTVYASGVMKLVWATFKAIKKKNISKANAINAFRLRNKFLKPMDSVKIAYRFKTTIKIKSKMSLNI